MKFIHTSDWHIGRQLHHRSLLEDQAHVLQQIVDYAREHQVDAVIIAGDIYDRSVPPAQAVSLLDDVLHQLISELKLQVFLIAGNHDGHERLGFASRHMADSGLHIVGPLQDEIDPVLITGKHGDAWVAGIPYADPVAVRHAFRRKLDAEHSQSITSHEQAMQLLLDNITWPNNSSLPRIVVGHCFLDGGEASDSERPLSIGGADRISPSLFSEFDYTALGHLHGPQHKGNKHTRYSGSILKYSFSEERHKKSVTLVEVNAGEPTTFELLPLKPLRDLRVIEGHLNELLERGVKDVGRDDYLMIRLLDTHAILDAMGKLRSVYPNVMHLERTGLMAQQPNLELNREHLQKGERQMFEDFFEQVSGEELSEKQKGVLDNTLADLLKAERSS